MSKGLSSIIKVLVVDDSPIMCKVLTNILNSDPRIIVAGVASNGREAIEVIPKLNPDIITMDMNMPVMDGFEATKIIMATHPTRILIISSSVFVEGMDKVFEAISFGALDVFEKSNIEQLEDKRVALELIEKIKFLSGIQVVRHPLANFQQKEEKCKDKRDIIFDGVAIHKQVVAIASSTGGPEALVKILKCFPSKFPVPILVVQHITKGFLEGMVEWLDRECLLDIKIAEDSEEMLPGTVYIAPCNMHMRIEHTGRIALFNEPAYEGHRPSADVMMKSVASAYGNKAIGLVLTGMGKDGAAGLKAIKDNKGYTIAQDEESSVIYGMPKAAKELGAADKIAPLESISNEIIKGLIK